jgi:hypothetical protein
VISHIQRVEPSRSSRLPNRQGPPEGSRRPRRRDREHELRNLVRSRSAFAQRGRRDPLRGLVSTGVTACPASE